MIHVLVVGQSYIAAESRKKIACLASCPDIKVSLIVPVSWEHPSFGRYEFQRDGVDANVTVFPVPIRNNGRPFAFSYALKPLWQAVQQIRPDIFQVEQEPGSLALFELGVLARLRRKARLVAFSWENLNYRQRGIRHYLEKIELSWLDYLTVGSTAAAQVFRDKGYHGPLAILPNVGVDTEHFSPRRALDLKQSLGLGDRYVIGFVGRLVPEKGCLDLLQAFALMPEDCHLLFVGDGSLRDHLCERAEQLGVSPRVTFQWTVPHPQVADFLNGTDCFVLPSRTIPNGWREQFGLALVQAMSCGVPVIGSNSGAIPEVIGDAGLIYAEGDVNALCDSLLRLKRDDALRAELGHRGRARVLDHYSNQRIAEQTYAIYHELLSH